jgi:hypothetical protein
VKLGQEEGGRQLVPTRKRTSLALQEVQLVMVGPQVRQEEAQGRHSSRAVAGLVPATVPLGH